jgi:hypothetical protein
MGNGPKPSAQGAKADLELRSPLHGANVGADFDWKHARAVAVTLIGKVDERTALPRHLQPVRCFNGQFPWRSGLVAQRVIIFHLAALF